MVLGDESGYATSEHQKMKLAAIEAMWETEPAPAGFNAFAIPDQKNQTNHYALHVPYVMGLIGTRSFNTEMPGILELVERAEGRIRNGLLGYEALQRLRADRNDGTMRASSSRSPLARHRPRAAAQALPRGHRQRDRGADRAGGARHHPARGAAVLELPPDGRAGLLLHRVLRGCVLPGQPATAGPVPLVPQGGVLEPAAALAGVDLAG